MSAMLFRTLLLSAALVAPVAALAGDSLAAPNARFVNGVGAVLDVVRSRHGHLLVQARVHGDVPGWYIFDSGAGSLVIDQQVARRLGLTTEETATARSGGGGATVPLHRLEGFSVGPMELAEVPAVEMDLAFLRRAMDFPVVGIVGHQVLAAAVVELRAHDAHIALHDPTAFDGAALDWHNALMVGNRPVVSAAVDAHPLRLLIDSGDFGTLTLYERAVTDLELLTGRSTRGHRQRTAGGTIRGRRGEVRELELGGQLFDTVETIFLTEGRSPHGIDGRIGVGLLGAYTLYIDNPNGRFALVPAVSH
jgi:predicted aspartyl protease